MPSWLPQEPSHKDVLSTWEGPDPWNPGGRLLREQIFKAKRPVEANKKDIAGNAHNKTRTWLPKESVRQHHHEKPVTHLVPIHHRPILPLTSQPVFHFQGPSRGHSII